MKLRKRKLPLMLIVVGLLLTLLPLLAAFQYRWLGQLSERERERMQANLRTAAANFSLDFDREVTRAFALLQMDVATFREKKWDHYASRYQQWQTVTEHPRIVSDIFLASPDRDRTPHLSRFNPTTGQFENTDWPPPLENWRARHEARFRQSEMRSEPSSSSSSAARGQEPHSTRETMQYLIGSLEANQAPRLKRSAPEDSEGNIQVQRVLSVETIDPEIPALAIPVLDPLPPWSLPRLNPPVGYLLITLDRRYILEELIPALARHYFSNETGLEYNLAIINRTDPKQIIYAAWPNSSRPEPAQADATVELLGLQLGELANLSIQSLPIDSTTESLSANGLQARVFSHRIDENTSAAQPPVADILRDRAQLRGLAITVVEQPEAGDKPPINRLRVGGHWQLLLRHNAGSLEAAVNSLRRRNLAISSGILLLLAVSMIMILVSTRRAQRLAEQQMEFVAGVSHELRTPLAVICSAGENLADGVITDAEQAKNYGSLIRREGRRLAEMVEQVLALAGVQSGRKSYELRPIDVGRLLEETLAAYRPALSDGGFDLEVEIEANLPLVQADATAMRSAIHNLLSNAMKYSGEDRRISLRARAVSESHGAEVRITVEDRGRGIAATDLLHIFEPFYRAREVTEAQIHGSGLGLSLVKHSVEAHGGRVTVKSTVSHGSVFTLHLPAMTEAPGPTGEPIPLVISDEKAVMSDE